jgi:hypothetical protein
MSKDDTSPIDVDYRNLEITIRKQKRTIKKFIMLVIFELIIITILFIPLFNGVLKSGYVNHNFIGVVNEGRLPFGDNYFTIESLNEDNYGMEYFIKMNGDFVRDNGSGFFNYGKTTIWLGALLNVNGTISSDSSSFNSWWSIDLKWVFPLERYATISGGGTTVG